MSAIPQTADGGGQLGGTTPPSAQLKLDIPREWLLTSNQRPHWAAKSKRTRALRDLAHWTARGLGQRDPFAEKMRLVVEVQYQDRRRHDVMNIQPTVKACVDGLVDCGWIQDDDSTHLIGPDYREIPQRCTPGAAVTLNFTFTPAEAS